MVAGASQDGKISVTDLQRGVVEMALQITTDAVRRLILRMDDAGDGLVSVAAWIREIGQADAGKVLPQYRQ